MTDRELLELAAKAVGAEPCMHRGIPTGTYTHPPENGILRSSSNGWSPLTDDGDALRLAVKLEMLIEVETCFYVSAMKGNICATEHIGARGEGCIYAATRRAIVRAAAEIGRAS